MWLLAHCYDGDELRCEERINSKYGFDTLVLSGMRTKCNRRTWPDVTLEEYVAFPEYVFFETFDLRIDWTVFKARTHVRSIEVVPNGDRYYEVPSEVIRELHLRQASGEFSDWRSNAIKYFKNRIGSTIKLPAEHRFGGAHVTVKAIVGDNLHWHFEMLGHETSGVIKLAKVWPKDKIAREHAAVIKLSEDLKFYLKQHPDQVETPLKLPEPPLNR